MKLVELCESACLVNVEYKIKYECHSAPDCFFLMETLLRKVKCQNTVKDKTS